jgi:sugar phosphate isomerase/epimerase
MRKLMLLAAALFMAAVSCSQPVPVKKEIGVQLYNYRKLIGTPEGYAQNHAEVFQALAGMGYTGVEAAGYKDRLFYGVAPEQFKADLEAAGLQAVSSHTTRNLSEAELASGDFSESLAWWDDAIADHLAAGMRYIVAPSFKIPETLKDLQTWCDYFNAVGAKCRAAGLSFGYHNHSREFQEIEGEVIEDYMLTHTDPENVFFQMDVYWAVMGQAAPVEYFQRYPGRFHMLHIKDRMVLGASGMLNFKNIFDKFYANGRQYFFIEIEDTNSGKQFERLEQSALYLNTSDFVK